MQSLTALAPPGSGRACVGLEAVGRGDCGVQLAAGRGGPCRGASLSGPFLRGAALEIARRTVSRAGTEPGRETAPACRESSGEGRQDLPCHRNGRYPGSPGSRPSRLPPCRKPPPSSSRLGRGCRDACCSTSHAATRCCGVECARAYRHCLQSSCIRCYQATCNRPRLNLIYRGIPGEGHQPRLPPEYGVSGTKPIQLYPRQVTVIESAGKTKKQEVRQD